MDTIEEEIEDGFHVRVMDSSTGASAISSSEVFSYTTLTSGDAFSYGAYKDSISCSEKKMIKLRCPNCGHEIQITKPNY